MNFRSRTAPALLTTLMTLTAFPGCSGGGSGGGGRFAVKSCNPTCLADPCRLGSVAPYQAISLSFNKPIDPLTVTNETVSLEPLSPGSTTNLLRTVEGNTVRIQPQVTLDPNGNLHYGLQANETYILSLPSHETQGSPAVHSRRGAANQREIRCSLQTERLTQDPNPSPLTVEVFVVRDPSNAPGTLESLDSGSNLGPIERAAAFVLVFDDLVNPMTLVDPVSGSPRGIFLNADGDGDLMTTADRFQIRADYVVEFNSAELETHVRIQPLSLLPFPGTGPRPRLCTIEFGTGIIDLFGTPLANPETRSFETQNSPVARGGILREFFDTTERFDASRSSGAWRGDGGVAQGLGGGTGKHGDLIVRSGETVIVDTAQYFVPPEDSLTGQAETVTDGVFEFSTILVERDGVLRFLGPHIAQVYAAGATVQGQLLASGESAPAHLGLNNPCSSAGLEPPNETGLGGAGGRGGPGAGDGGRGGDDPRPIGMPPGGLPRTMAPVSPDGRDGLGSLGQPGAAMGAGGASLAFPATTISTDPELRLAGVILEPFLDFSRQLAGGGGGGSYFTAGMPGDQGETDPNLGGQPGLPGHVTLPDPQIPRSMPGGAGGGGAGTHPYNTNRNQLGECPSYDPKPTLGSQPIIEVWNSGTGGGGGGGVLILQVGNELDLRSGEIAARGGHGGDSVGMQGSFSATGGGGSGGAVRIQTTRLNSNALSFLDVRGGLGGQTTFRTSGGQGGDGVMRLSSRVGSMQGGFLPTNAMTMDPYLEHEAHEYSRVASTWYAAQGMPFVAWTDFECLYTHGAPGMPQITAALRNEDLVINGGTWPSFPDAPFNILFQGARSDSENQPLPGTSSTWVNDPALLPEHCNLIRFTIVFHRTRIAQEHIAGVTELTLLFQEG